jgi:peptidoglycan/xylan/chitin deacetylase (PgdA/CDA1 family)
MGVPIELTLGLSIGIGGSLVLGLVLCIYVQPQPLIWLLARCTPNVVWYVETTEAVAALSIDDAPYGDGSGTEAILDVLARLGIKATFFIISGNVTTERHRELLKRMVAEGHELGNHMRTDCKAVALSSAEYHKQLEHCDQLLREFLPPPGRVRWHRPGGGFFSKRTVKITTDFGLRTALGNVYPHDAFPGSSKWCGCGFPFPCLNSWHLRTRARKGAVIVVHDRPHAPSTLARSLPAISTRLQLVTVSALCDRSAVPQQPDAGGNSDPLLTDPARM